MRPVILQLALAAALLLLLAPAPLAAAGVGGLLGSPDELAQISPTASNSTGNATDGKRETIAQMLDDALKQEFKKEEEAHAEQGKQFEETAKKEEGTQETVILISGRKERDRNRERNATASAGASPSFGGATGAGVGGAGSMTTGAGSGETKGGSGVGGGAAGGDSGAASSGGQGVAAGGSASAPPGSVSGSADASGLGNASGLAGGDPPPTPQSASGSNSHLVEPEVDRIIDSKDNEYVLSRPSEDGAMGITLDPQLVRDLTVLVAGSAAAGLGMEALGQPSINGYFVLGSAVGPGGLRWVKEIVQVQSLSQIGVQLLLFELGLEFSLAKLRAVRGVALAGGALQILVAAALGAALSAAVGGSANGGAFVGAILAMSSTSIVVRVLGDRRAASSLVGQIAIGTLVLQDCAVGVLFAALPLVAARNEAALDAAEDAAEAVRGRSLLGATGLGLAPDGAPDSVAALRPLAAAIGRALLEGPGGPGGGAPPHHAGPSALLEACAALARVCGTLGALGALTAVAATHVLPGASRALARVATPPTFQLVAVGFCFTSALVTSRLGVSAELGAFLAGVSMSRVDAHEALLRRLAPLAHFFVALFVSTTGLALAPRFLLHHLPVLGAGCLLVAGAKAALIASVVALFGYPPRVAASVGLGLAQVGEFAFVLLSLSKGAGILSSNFYMLLMGITALSLLITPALMHLSLAIAPPGTAGPADDRGGSLGGGLGPGGSGPGEIYGDSLNRRASASANGPSVCLPTISTGGGGHGRGSGQGVPSPRNPYGLGLGGGGGGGGASGGGGGGGGGVGGYSSSASPWGGPSAHHSRGGSLLGTDQPTSPSLDLSSAALASRLGVGAPTTGRDSFLDSPDDQPLLPLTQSEKQHGRTSPPPSALRQGGGQGRGGGGQPHLELSVRNNLSGHDKRRSAAGVNGGAARGLGGGGGAAARGDGREHQPGGD